MRTLRSALARLASLVRRHDDDRDFSAELNSHLDMHVADNMRAGMTPEEARRRALVALGGIEQTKERYRDRRGTPIVEQFIQDLRFAARMLTRDRGFAATVVVVLGLGIAVTNTFLILTYAICLRGLPIDSPERVFFIRARDAADRTLGMSFDDFNDLRASSSSFAAVAALAGGPIALGDASRAAERFRGAYVSSDTFRLLGERPVAGRDFEPQDDQPGSPSVVILGSSVWTSRYSGDPSIVGSTIRVNGVPSAVIGIMPDRSKYPNDAEVWQPLAASREVAREKRDNRDLAMMVRLEDRTTPAAARAELTSIWSRLAKIHPDTNGNVRLEVVPVNRQYAGDINHPAWFAFLTAGFLVLIVACANVANLLLMRGTHRIRELAIRGSLGATRPRIIRQLLAESVLLAALGGMFGITLALISARLLWSLHPAGTLPYWMHFSMDGPILALVVAVCLTTSLIFGIVPAYQITRGNANLALKSARRGATRGPSSRRWTSVFLVVQYAIALTFLGTISVAAQLLESQDRRDPYIEASRLLTGSIALPPQRYGAPEARAAFYDTLRDRLAQVPGLESIAIANALPLGGATSRQLIVEGAPAQTTGPRPMIWTVVISPSYFETLGLGLFRGRAFHERDGVPGHENVIVNQRFVEIHYSHTDPIGKRIALAVSGGEVASWLTIIGVAPSVRQRPAPVADPIVYLPFRANPEAQFSLIARRGPISIVPVLREQIRLIDADVPLFRVMTLAAAMRDANWNNRLSSLMANFVTFLAVLLSAVGLYALISHAVAQLTPEIGIRVAMGAQPHQVAWRVVRRGLFQFAIGVVAGVVFAVASSSVLSSGNTSSAKAGELLVAALILSVVSLVAIILPTLRAIRVSPAVALRYE